MASKKRHVGARYRHLVGLFCCALVLPVFGPGLLAREQAAPRATVKTLFDQMLAECGDPAERQAILREATVVFSERIQQAQAMLGQDADEAHEIIEQVIDKTWELMDLKENNRAAYKRQVALYTLDNNTMALARRVRQSKGAERKKLTAQLQQMLQAYFDRKQENIKAEVQMHEREAARLKQLYAKRQQRRARLIERKLRDMLDEDDVEW